jgi:transposase-like protein
MEYYRKPSKAQVTGHNKYKKSGIYQLQCPDCHRKYTGQTGRSFYQCYSDFKNRNYSSNFAKHLLDNNHSIGPITDVMEVLHVTKKWEHMNTLEKFHVCIETKNNNQIDEKCTGVNNILFDAVISGDIT